MNHMKVHFRLLALAASASLAAGETTKENTVILDAQGVKNLRLEMVEAQEIDFEESVFALGRIKLLPGKKAVVSSRIAGRAVSVIALPDMKCEAGDELMWIESRLAGDPPPIVRIDAPISGLIAEVAVAPGQPITPDSSLLEIYDLETVEASAAVPEHFAGKLKKGIKAHIKVAGFPEKTFEAELAHLGARADADTGTLEAAFHVPNPDDLLRPGMRAEFTIVTGSRPGVMAIPREAVQGDATARYVYVADYDLKNAFVKTPVELGEQNESMVEVINGLLPGDQVVTKGAYALGFAGKGSVSLKEALDAAHGHPHNEDGSEMTKEDAAKNSGGAAGGQDHDHAHESSTLTVFFAGTSALLLVLLVLSLMFRRPATV
ncbi:MAG: efflux RND transporter periplasmic adaptor subunit [Verrucomicrobiales bacterium]